jgi:PAS domain S-box-containing protein
VNDTSKSEGFQLVGQSARKTDEESFVNAEKAARFHAQLLNTIEQAVIGTDLNGVITYWNRFARTLYGWSAEEAAGHSIFELITPGFEIRQARQIWSLLRQGKSWKGEFTVQRKDRTTFPAQITVAPLYDDERRLTGFVGLSDEIMRRKQAVRALRESEDKYRTLVEQASDGIHTYDFQGNFIDTNSKLCEMLGYTREELLKLNVKDLIPAEDMTLNPIRFDELTTGKTLIRERRLLRKDGSIMPVEISGRMVQDGVLQAIIRDITERKKTLEELQRSRDEFEFRVIERTRELEESNKARIEALHQLVTVQEDERQRIARDLHDQLGQQLTALRLKLKILKRLSECHEELSVQVGEVQEVARQLDWDVDFLAWQMRPTALDDLGIVAALDYYVRQWSRNFRISAEFDAARFGMTEVAPEVGASLYRIAQEGLNNIYKHARATKVNIFLEVVDDFAVLIIEDNGVGFEKDGRNLAGDRFKGMGLIGMHERAALVNGTVEVESAAGAGTTVYARFPVLSEEKKKNEQD